MAEEYIQIEAGASQEYFGPLSRYIEDDDVTDIDYNGHEVWLTDSSNTRYIARGLDLSDEFVEQFTRRVSNDVSKPFHKMAPVLEAETDTLRITIVHESVCQGMRCFCIRKSLPSVRLTEENALSSGYASKEMLEFLKNCIRSRMNVVFAGNPGAGKTECAKFFSQYIPAHDRVITIEDNPEWHYRKLNPGKDCVEMKIGKSMDYTDAIKTCLRLNPAWMVLSEARSTEVRYLLEGFSTGVRGITTLHTDDVRKIPDRVVNMIGQDVAADRIENDVYSFIDVGVLIKRKVSDETGSGKVRRYIDEICLFSREGKKNKVTMIAEDGMMTGNDIPDCMMKKFNDAGIFHPFGFTGEPVKIPMNRVEGKCANITGFLKVDESGYVAETGREYRVQDRMESDMESDAVSKDDSEKAMEEVRQEMLRFMEKVGKELDSGSETGATYCGRQAYI